MGCPNSRQQSEACWGIFNDHRNSYAIKNAREFLKAPAFIFDEIRLRVIR